MTSDQLSALSDSLFSASIVIYAVAALAFCAELAFGRHASRRSAALAPVGAAHSAHPSSDGTEPRAITARSTGQR